METVQCEIWIMVDENGEYEIAKDAADLQANPGDACRMVRVTVNVPVPKTVELEATIEPEPTAAELKVA